jgi:hypothetical protein
MYTLRDGPNGSLLLGSDGAWVKWDPGATRTEFASGANGRTWMGEEDIRRWLTRTDSIVCQSEWKDETMRKYGGLEECDDAMRKV